MEEGFRWMPVGLVSISVVGKRGPLSKGSVGVVGSRREDLREGIWWSVRREDVLVGGLLMDSSGFGDSSGGVGSVGGEREWRCKRGESREGRDVLSS